MIGGDPETGDPLPLTLWDEDEGGKVVGVVAKKGSGKSVLLSLHQRADHRLPRRPADPGQPVQGTARTAGGRRWRSPTPSAGRTQTRQARRILQWVADRDRGTLRDRGDAPEVTPTPGTPLYVVEIDEIDQVAADPVCQALLAKIASKCRSEGFALIIAGQRATAQWMGGGDLRANVDIAVLGRFARAGEARKATGEEFDLPDMGEYGEGRPGVFLITELGGGGGYERGRVFKLSDPAAIDAIVARRAADLRPLHARARLRPPGRPVGEDHRPGRR